jgi:hypothetical protein
MGARCTICNDESLCLLVDSSITAGVKPSHLVEAVQKSGKSRSALFRHVRSHVARSVLTPDWVDLDTTSGDVLVDLGALRTRLLAQYESQAKAGLHAVSNRSAAVALSASQELLKNGVHNEGDLDAHNHLQLFQRLIGTAARRRPDIAAELAEVARDAMGEKELAGSLEELHKAITATNPTHA